MNTPSVLEPIAGCTELIPRWMHPDQAVTYSGLGRTFLYGLIAAEEVDSVRISKNNKAKGRAIRLIDRWSLDRWILKHKKDGDEGE
ncbi:unnamed protein product [uncultured bacterium]|nr:unnamed protein product [uncultured bacterium]